MINKKISRVLILGIGSIWLTGCNPKTEVVDATAPIVVDTETGVLTDVKRLVSYGQSRTFNNRTAGVNDLELNSLTRSPAVAYYDQDQRGTSSATTRGALKYSYMDNSGNWNIEIVDVSYGSVSGAGACGTANTFCIGAPNAAAGGLAQVINLAFKSDGTPIIAYVFGASFTTVGDREIRIAERSTNGDWTISRAFTVNNGNAAAEPSQVAAVNSMTGLTLLVDDEDRPHITFAHYTSTNTSSKIKYLFRDLSGAWTSADIMNAITGAGTITAFTHGSIQAGAAWCSLGTNSSTPTAPMGVYAYQVITAAAGASAQPVFINCTTVATNGRCTSWNTLNLVNGCTGVACVSTFAAGTNAGNRIDMTIEPTSGKPVIALYSVATPNTQLGSVVAPVACNSAQTSTAGSWGTMASIDTAAVNINGVKIVAGSSTDFIAAYNVTTATTRVMRTTTGHTGWAGLAGHIVETSTVGAEGVGAAYDVTNGNLFVSWGSGSNGAAGAVTNDLKVGTINVSNISNGSLAGLFNIDVIDNTGSAFPNPTAGNLPLMSASKAVDGTVGYSYFYIDATGADMRLFYGVRYSIPERPLFIETQVVNFQEGTTAALAVGLNPSLAYDSDSNPVISFYNGVAAEQNLNVARSNNGGQNFSITTVDDTVANVGQYASTATFEDSIGVAYKDVTNTSLKFARWTPGDRWRRFTIDGNSGAGGAGCSVTNASGDFAKLALTSEGRPVVVYQDDTTPTPAILKIAVADEDITSNTFTWRCLSLDTVGNSGVGRGEGIDIVLDSSDKAHITHFDATAGTIRFVVSSTDINEAVVTGSSAFSEATVATVGVPIILSSYVVPSIQVNSSGNVYISYHDKNNYRYALATKLSGSSSFTFETIDSGPIGGSNSSVSGSYGDMILNSSGYPTIIYGSFGSWIKYFSRELF